MGEDQEFGYAVFVMLYTRTPSFNLRKLEEFFMPETMTNTRKIAHIAILATLSFLLMYLQFPLIPSASFLQFDFSILPVLIGLVMFDLKSAFGILILRTLLKLLLNNGGISTIIGLPMNVIALGVFVVALAILWKQKPSFKNYVIASVVGTLGLTVVMFVLNYIYAVPLYAKFANFDISTILGLGNYLFAMVIPFNLIEGVIFSVTFFILYSCLKPILKID